MSAIRPLTCDNETSPRDAGHVTEGSDPEIAYTIGGLAVKATRTCSDPSCDRNGKLTRGMCAKHYRAWLDHTPTEERATAPRFARTFRDYVDKDSSSTGCWLWTGPTNRKGYGWWSNGDERGLAHRLTLAAANPPPSPDLFACHHCDNPPCVNPEHLYWGTAADNAADVMARSRVVNGNSVKTHCKRGHLLSGDNLQIVGAVRARQCRTCGNERSRIKMAERRAKESSGV